MSGELLTINGECGIIEFPITGDSTMKLTSTDIKRFWEKIVKHPTGCWEWQAATLQSGGYGAFRCAGATLRAHRVAFFLCKGNLNPELEILHLCNNPKCCNPDHLKQDTHSANLAQAGVEGKMTRHSGANSKTQFSEEILRDILTSSCSARELGRRYKVDHKTIRSIQKEFQLCYQE
jgi:hypothetical protein